MALCVISFIAIIHMPFLHMRMPAIWGRKTATFSKYVKPRKRGQKNDVNRHAKKYQHGVHEKQ